MFDQRAHQHHDPASFNLFEQSFSKKLVETNLHINGGGDGPTQDTHDVVESLSRLSPSILIGPTEGNYTTTVPNFMPLENSLLIMHSPSKNITDPEERRRVSQERNRLAAVKSRLKKKQEWYRLLEAEQLLRHENEMLRYRIRELESILSAQTKASRESNPKTS